LSQEHKHRIVQQNIKDSKENLNQMLSQKEQSIRENHDKLRQVFKDRGAKSNTDIKGNLQEINKRVVLAQSNLNQIKA